RSRERGRWILSECLATLQWKLLQLDAQKIGTGVGKVLNGMAFQLSGTVAERAQLRGLPDQDGRRTVLDPDLHAPGIVEVDKQRRQVGMIVYADRLMRAVVHTNHRDLRIVEDEFVVLRVAL